MYSSIQDLPLQDIEDYSKQQFPNEACGIVVVRKGRYKFIPCKNVHPYPTDFFEIDSVDYISAENQGQVVAVFHSHPSTTESASFEDIKIHSEGDVPWIIFSCLTENWFELKNKTIVDLYGRKYIHAITDCYSFIKDYYKIEHNILLDDFKREDEWWNRGQSLYLDNYKSQGFYEIDIGDTREGDMLLMQINSNVPNHAGIYINDNKVAHHFTGRLSCIDVYGKFLRDTTRLVLRHKDI